MITTLSVNDLHPGMVTASRIFARDEKTQVIRAHTVLTPHLIERLIHHEVQSVAIDLSGLLPEDDSPQYSSPAPILDEKIKEEAVVGIRSLFHSVKEGEKTGNMTTAYQVVKEVDTVVDKLVNTLQEEPNALVRISDLKSYDEYTYHHSLSVAVLSIAIGQSLGLSPDALNKLGRAAMMHDIGKILIPPEILNKPGRLTDEEFNIIKTHSEKGYEYLVKAGIGDKEIRLAVRGHHESMDGAGYPQGLSGENIPLMSRIMSVADVYDAVTSYRPYRSPMPPAEAMELVMSKTGISFDYMVVKSFTDKMEMYPNNTIVELSNGRRGVVVNTEHTMRPVLHMLDTDEHLDLMGLGNLNLIIVKVLME